MEGSVVAAPAATTRARRLERMTADYWRQMTRTGGTYIPPKRMPAEAQELPERGSEAFQRLSWDALRRSLNGLINKVNAPNLREIVRELIGENLIRGRGLFVRAVMKAQAASIMYTPVYAALVVVLNTKFPLIGELLITRLVSQFRRTYRRNDKTQCVAVATFLAHLVNQRALHDICVLQMLMLLLDRPTDDSVEIAVGLMKECGAAITELSPKPANAVFERFRAVLHEGAIDKRVQYMIEVLFQVRKEKFKDNVIVPPELELVEEEDQITHYVMLDDELDTQDSLNVFSMDPEFIEHEEEYETIKRDILGDEDSDEEREDEDGSEGGDAGGEAARGEGSGQLIKDQTETNLINFRKTVYLTIMSSMDFEECGHKLLKLSMPEGFEIELCHMIAECCSNERNYLKFFGLLAERFCKIDPLWRESFERCFSEMYATVHRLDTNRIRNIAKLFGHLFQSDAVTWAVLECVRLTEEDTSSASRIFVKFLLQDLAEFYGVPKLLERFNEPDLMPYFEGLFPSQNPVHIRFSVNFFTAVGLAGLTDSMRERLLALQSFSLVPAHNGFVVGAEPHEHLPALLPATPPSEACQDRASERPYRSRSRSRSAARSRSRPRSRTRARPRSRSRSRTRARPRSRSKSRPRSRSRSKTRPRSRSRSKTRPRSRSRSRSTRNRNALRSLSRGRSGWPFSHRERTRSRSCDRSPGRGRLQRRDRSQDRPRSRGRDRSYERGEWHRSPPGRR